jgi:hypothetical protein
VVRGDAVDDVADANVAHHVSHGGGRRGDGDDEADDADELHRHHFARLGEEPLEVRRNLPRGRIGSKVMGMHWHAIARRGNRCHCIRNIAKCKIRHFSFRTAPSLT